MQKKIILFIPSIENGGVEKNFFLISNFLSKYFDKIFIITSDKKFKNSFKKNIIVICPKTRFWEKKNRLLKTIISIFLLIKNFFNQDIVLLSFQSNIAAITISKILGFKILIRLNTSLKKYLNSYIKKKIFKFFYYLADEIIVNSLSFKRELKSNLDLRSLLIYNSLSNISKDKKISYFKKFKKLKIINIGRLTDQKDQIILLKGLNLLIKKKINFRCCIIGEGKKKKELQDFIERNKLNKNVKLIGYKKNAEDYLRSGDLFILSSKYEGLPNVLIEAQSKGVPIISSDCPTGAREILLNGKLGDLFPVGDYKKLSFLISKFNSSKKRLLRLSKKSKKYLNRFDFKTNCLKYKKILEIYI